MSKKQKLELTWIGKENRPRLEPRILLEDPEKSYHAKHRVKEGGITRRRGDAEDVRGVLINKASRGALAPGKTASAVKKLGKS